MLRTEVLSDLSQKRCKSGGYSLEAQAVQEIISHETEAFVRARELVERYGSDTLSYFNLRRDKRLFFLNDEIFLAYRIVKGVAVVSSDPVGPAELVPSIIKDFRNYCRENRWRLALFATGEEYDPLYRECGLKSFFLGEETVVDVDGFSLEGRKMSNVRHAACKLEKSGATMEIMFNAGIPSHLRRELREVSLKWRGDKPETGYAMGLGRVFDPEDKDCLLCIAYDGGYNPIGFLQMAPVYPNLGYSLDIARTIHQPPNGLMEFMLVNTAQFLKKRGCRYMSLHFCFYSQHYREDRERKGSELARIIAKLVNLRLPVISIYNFDKRFVPIIWKKRYIIFEKITDFPRVGAAIISAEDALHLR
jgi:lysyl-tRNA synthetase class 2